MSGTILYSCCLQHEFPKSVCETLHYVANSVNYFNPRCDLRKLLEYVCTLLPDTVEGEPMESTELWELCHQQIEKPAEPVVSIYLKLRMYAESTDFTFAKDDQEYYSISQEDMNAGLRNLFSYWSQFPWDEFADWQVNLLVAMVKTEYTAYIQSHTLPAPIQPAKPKPQRPTAPETLSLEHPESLEEWMGQVDMKDNLYRAVEKLPSKYRLVIALYYGLFEEDTHTQAEIGEMLGVSQGYVGQLKRRALFRLRKSLEASGV